MALKTQKMIIFPFIVCPECFLTNILWLVELNDVGKFKVPSNDGHLEEIVRNGGSGSKEDEKDQNDHTSEGCGRRSTAAARNSVRHRWSFVDRDPRTPPTVGAMLSTTVSNGSVHTQAERMMACRRSIKRWQSSPKHSSLMQPRCCGRRLRAGCAADFCVEGNPPLCSGAPPSTAIISLSSWPPNLHNDDENQHYCYKAAKRVSFEDKN